QFLLVNRKSGLVLGCESDGGERGKFLMQAEDQRKAHQQWLFANAGRGPDAYFIRNAKSGLYINISGSLNEDAVMSLWSGDAGTHNLGIPTKVGSGYTFRRHDSSRFLTASGMTAGSKIVQKTLNNGDEQVWDLRPLAAAEKARANVRPTTADQYPALAGLWQETAGISFTITQNGEQF